MAECLNDAAGGMYSYHWALNLAGGLGENCVVNFLVEISNGDVTEYKSYTLLRESTGWVV